MLPGVNELILTLLVVFLLFGATRVPKVIKYAGKTRGEFKEGQKEGKEGLEKVEQRIREIEEKNTGKDTSVNLSRVKLSRMDLSGFHPFMNKEYSILTLGLLVIAAGVILTIVLGERSVMAVALVGLVISVLGLIMSNQKK